jgi:hypothetical protein
LVDLQAALPSGPGGKIGTPARLLHPGPARQRRGGIVEVSHFWRFDLTPNAVRRYSPLLRALLDSLERRIAKSQIWGDDSRAISDHIEIVEYVMGIAKLMGIPPGGTDESSQVGLDARIPLGKWPVAVHDTLERFTSLGDDLFAVVNRLIAAGFNGVLVDGEYEPVLPACAKVPLPCEQLMEQVRDVAKRFEQLQNIINSGLASRICGWVKGQLASFFPTFQRVSAPSEPAVCRTRNRDRKNESVSGVNFDFPSRLHHRLVAPDHCTAGKVSHSDIDQT